VTLNNLGGGNYSLTTVTRDVINGIIV
jgi:hypothetical protein